MSTSVMTNWRDRWMTMAGLLAGALIAGGFAVQSQAYAAPAAATMDEASVAGAGQSPADFARAEAALAAVQQKIAALKSTDPTLASETRKTADEIQDDLTYLKVKQRRESNVTAKDLKELNDRIETLRVRVQSSTVTAQPVLGDEPVEKVVTVPVGTLIDVRLQTPLNSGTAKVEDRFEATSLVDVTQANVVAIPAGSVVRGFVSSVRPAGRLDRKGSLTLSFDEIVVYGKRPPMRASLVQAMEGKMGEDAGRITTGAIAGAIIGGIIGGGKGALAGIIVGGGGTIAATEGSNADLPVGTILRIRLDQPLEVTIK